MRCNVWVVMIASLLMTASLRVAADGVVQSSENERASLWNMYEVTLTSSFGTAQRVGGLHAGRSTRGRSTRGVAGIFVY